MGNQFTGGGVVMAKSERPLQELRKIFHQVDRQPPRQQHTIMGRRPQLARGKMSSYAFFVQTLREEHKESFPTPQSIAEFSEIQRRWNHIQAVRKVKLKTWQKVTSYRQEMKIMSLLKVTRRKEKRSQRSKRPPPPSSCFAQTY